MFDVETGVAVRPFAGSEELLWDVDGGLMSVDLEVGGVRAEAIVEKGWDGTWCAWVSFWREGDTDPFDDVAREKVGTRKEAVAHIGTILNTWVDPFPPPVLAEAPMERPEELAELFPDGYSRGLHEFLVRFAGPYEMAGWESTVEQAPSWNLLVNRVEGRIAVSSGGIPVCFLSLFHDEEEPS